LKPLEIEDIYYLYLGVRFFVRSQAFREIW